jgi:hypothetical protein
MKQLTKVRTLRTVATARTDDLKTPTIYSIPSSDELFTDLTVNERKRPYS